MTDLLSLRTAVLALCENFPGGEELVPSIRRVFDGKAAEVERLVSAREVGELLSLSRSSVWRLARDGKLTPVLVGGRSPRYRLSEVEALATGKISFEACPRPRNRYEEV